MSLQRPSLFLAGALLIGLLSIQSTQGTTLSFDDFIDTHAGGGTLITNVYQGLGWSNFAVANAVTLTLNSGLSGAYYGMLSLSNVAINAHGGPAEIDAAGAKFNFYSAYLTGVWRSNLNIEVQGYRSGSLLYDTNVIASATMPILFTFNYADVDRVAFNASGGEYAGFPAGGDGTVFALDDMMIEFVPEPSSLLLCAVGALTLWALIKRQRA